MRFFSRFRKDPPADLETIEQIRERVREMRKRINRGEVELSELFALIGEDERRLSSSAEPQPAQTPRGHAQPAPPRTPRIYPFASGSR